ncbi:MAG: hypothetical protein ACRDDZ_11080 [Marinifilaceae bacterium]
MSNKKLPRFSELGITVKRGFVGKKHEPKELEGETFDILDWEIKPTLNPNKDKSDEENQYVDLQLRLHRNGKKARMWGTCLLIQRQLIAIESQHGKIPFATKLINEDGWMLADVD